MVLILHPSLYPHPWLFSIACGWAALVSQAKGDAFSSPCLSQWDQTHESLVQDQRLTDRVLAIIKASLGQQPACCEQTPPRSAVTCPPPSTWEGGINDAYCLPLRSCGCVREHSCGNRKQVQTLTGFNWQLGSFDFFLKIFPTDNNHYLTFLCLHYGLGNFRQEWPVLLTWHSTQKIKLSQVRETI